MIIDYRERDPNLWALSAMPLPSQRNTRHISLFSCPSHRHQPSPGAQVQLLSSDTFHPQVMEGEGTPRFYVPRQKAPHPSSLKRPLLLQKILHPIFPNIANTSPSKEGCHLLKLKAKYIEATLFEVNYESSLVRWGKHTRQQRSESPSPPRKSIPQQDAKHRKQGGCERGVPRVLDGWPSFSWNQW